jgi:hypothetical protein
MQASTNYANDSEEWLNGIKGVIIATPLLHGIINSSIAL